jgi:hypothetical protein
MPDPHLTDRVILEIKLALAHVAEAELHWEKGFYRRVGHSWHERQLHWQCVLYVAALERVHEF